MAVVGVGALVVAVVALVVAGEVFVDGVVGGVLVLVGGVVGFEVRVGLGRVGLGAGDVLERELRRVLGARGVLVGTTGSASGAAWFHAVAS